MLARYKCVLFASSDRERPCEEPDWAAEDDSLVACSKGSPCQAVDE